MRANHVRFGFLRTTGSVAVLTIWASILHAQGTTPIDALLTRQVGGISINADGMLDNARTDPQGDLSRRRATELQKVPHDLGRPVAMRRVSLAGLAKALKESQQSGKPPADAIVCLGGLRQIRYVLVYPEQKDIVLVGPGEGWKVDAQGNAVGIATGRPIMLLDDLLVALRSARDAAQGGITCSIDPSREGLQRLKAYRLHAGDDPRAAGAALEQVLGKQDISFTGVPATSHFAQVLIAADYRMKRIAMKFEPSPVRGLKSYLDMVAARPTNMLPRWWLEPKYEGILRDPEGLAWEFRGGGVKAMTDEDFVSASGARQRTGKPSVQAKRWADSMTACYEELSVAEPIFGQLRNCMDLALVGALISKENLAAKAGLDMAPLLDARTIKTNEYPIPKQVDSKASILKRGNNWIISASGGIAIHSWMIVDGARKSEAPAAARSKASAGRGDLWYWN